MSWEVILGLVLLESACAIRIIYETADRGFKNTFLVRLINCVNSYVERKNKWDI
jgi:hypothetical protein